MFTHTNKREGLQSQKKIPASPWLAAAARLLTLADIFPKATFYNNYEHVSEKKAFMAYYSRAAVLQDFSGDFLGGNMTEPKQSSFILTKTSNKGMANTGQREIFRGNLDWIRAFCYSLQQLPQI